MHLVSTLEASLSTPTLHISRCPPSPARIRPNSSSQPVRNQPRSESKSLQNGPLRPLPATSSSSANSQLASRPIHRTSCRANFRNACGPGLHLAIEPRGLGLVTLHMLRIPRHACLGSLRGRFSTRSNAPETSCRPPHILAVGPVCLKSQPAADMATSMRLDASRVPQTLPSDR